MEWITDRTQADINRYYVLKNTKGGFMGMNEEEKAEWLAGMKGCLNYQEWNTVISNYRNLNTRLVALGYPNIESNLNDFAVCEATSPYYSATLPTGSELGAIYMIMYVHYNALHNEIEGIQRITEGALFDFNTWNAFQNNGKLIEEWLDSQGA